MEKSIQTKIIKQIQQLCEKQYRKGFQQGYHACLENKLSATQVDKFRLQGMRENYSKVVDPITGRPQVAIKRLLSEIAMPDMEELHQFLNSL